MWLRLLFRAFTSSPPLSWLDQASCVMVFVQNKQEKRVSWNKAKDLTPKHNIGVKAPRHKPDTFPRVFVWRNGMWGGRQVPVAQIVYFPAERCNLSAVFNVLAALCVLCSTQISGTSANCLWAILKRGRSSLCNFWDVPSRVRDINRPYAVMHRGVWFTH